MTISITPARTDSSVFTPLLEPGHAACPITTLCLLTISLCKEYQFYMMACRIVVRQIYYCTTLAITLLCLQCVQDAWGSLGCCRDATVTQNLQAECVV